MAAFEIKTARDRLDRLPRQAPAYARLFDRCTAVLAERHVDAALEILADWWGILVIGAGQSSEPLRMVRPATLNPTVDKDTVVRLLWRDEVREILCALGEEPDEHASRASMWRHLVSSVHLEGLKEWVRRALLARDPSRARIPTRRFAAGVSR